MIGIRDRTLRKISFNTFSVMGAEVLNKAGVFVLYAIVARQAGLQDFGKLSLGMMLLYTFQVFAVAGLPVVLTRSVAKHPRRARRLLRHGSLASALSSLSCLLMMVGLAFAMGYEASTTRVISILALAVPAYALTVIAEAVIKGREQMHLIAFANVPGNAFLVLCSYLCLRFGFGVVGVAWIVVLSRFVTLLTMRALLNFNSEVETRRYLRLRFSWLLLRKAFVFLGTDGLQAINASVFVLLLSKFGTESDVGLLAASVQLLQPMQVFYRSVGHSLFPSLVAAAKEGASAVGELTQRILAYMLRLAFPATLVVFCLSQDVLSLVYGSEGFADSAYVLQITVFTLLLTPLSPLLGHGLWAMDHEDLVFWIVVVNLVARVVLGVVLISAYGLVGAAWGVLGCAFLNTLQHYVCFQKNVASLHLGRELLRMFPAVCLALVCVAVLPLNHFMATLFALAAYALAILLPYAGVVSQRGLQWKPGE